jgi:hypothetical protein
MCREFSSKMGWQNGKDSAIPAAEGNSPLLGFGMDTAAAAVTVADHPKGRVYINDTARSWYVAIAMKAMSASWAWNAAVA